MARGQAVLDEFIEIEAEKKREREKERKG